MPVFKLYSKRLADIENSDEPDFYQYDTVENSLRFQVRHIFRDFIGDTGYNPMWSGMKKILLKEYGRPFLVKDYYHDDEDVLEFLGNCSALEFLDTVEVSLRLGYHFLDGRSKLPYNGVSQSVLDAKDEINSRFLNSKFGYQFEEGQIIKLDSDFIHAEITKPALQLLRDHKFADANSEYLLAHDHFVSGNSKDAIVAANRSFESAMKSVCKDMGWSFSEKSRASDLCKILKANDFWPEYSVKSIEQLLATLNSGLPEVRNNSGGHGSGNEDIIVSEEVVAYALNLTAANIALLAGTLKNKAK